MYLYKKNEESIKKTTNDKEEFPVGFEGTLLLLCDYWYYSFTPHLIYYKERLSNHEFS